MNTKATFLICACILLSGLFVGLMAHQWKPYPEPGPIVKVKSPALDQRYECFTNGYGLSCIPVS